MENRYQRFLKEILRPGLEELVIASQKNLVPQTVAEIPYSTFNILIRAFRSAFFDQKTLPEHNLGNPDYLKFLINQIDRLLSQQEIFQAEEETIANIPPLASLLIAYEEAKKKNQEAINKRKSWQSLFEEQVKKYNQELIFRIQEQLKTNLPSLNEQAQEQLAKDIARTIQDQALPAIETPWAIQEKIQQVAETALKTYASTAKEIREDPNKISQISQAIAQKEKTIQEESDKEGVLSPETASLKKTVSLWDLRIAQENKEGRRVEKVDLDLRTAILANLPPEVYQNNPKIIEEISGQVLGRLSLPSLASQPTPQDYQKELAKEIESAINIVISDEQKRAKIASAITSQVSQEAQEYSISKEASMASVPTPTPGAPPLPPLPATPVVPPRSELEGVLFSSGYPGHFLTALLSPRAGEDLIKWTITGGPIRMATGFVLDSIPGVPKTDYFLDLFGPYVKEIKGGFQNELFKIADSLPFNDQQTLAQLLDEGKLEEIKNFFEEKGLLKDYQNQIVAKEAFIRLRLIQGLENELAKRPWLKGISEGKNLISTIFHPLNAIRLSIMHKNLGAGLVFGALTDSISAYIKYGGYGGAYVSEQVLKQFAIYGLKILGKKVGLYEVVGVFPHQKYVFKPTYRLKLKIQKAIYQKIPSRIKKAFSNLLQKIATRLGVSITALAGGIGIALGIIGFLWKPLKEAGKVLLILLAILIVKYGPVLVGAIAGGIVGGFIGGPVGFFAGAFAGAGAGILWVNLTGGAPVAAGVGTTAIIGETVSTSLASYTTPILVSTGATVLPLTALTVLTISTAFFEQSQFLSTVYFSDCSVENIHKTETITDTNKEIFVAKFSSLFPNGLLKQKIDEVIEAAKSVNFNPALLIAIWGEESHFSNYGEKVGEVEVLPGNDFGCGVNCSLGRPQNFEQSLACFIGKNQDCNNICLDKPDFASFMECYGPAAQNPNFISNVLYFYKELVPFGPDAIICPGGTTGEYASKLINILIECYDKINRLINKNTLNDEGKCLTKRGVVLGVALEIVNSVKTFGALQCVGFVQAVEAARGGTIQNTSYPHAKDYYLSSTPGYQNIPASQKNVRIGDIAVWGNPSDTKAGHMGIVIEVAPDMSWFRVAQAIGLDSAGGPYGLVNESGRLPITDPYLLGFLRRK